MESLDYWRICDELSIIQAALLIAGNDPSVDQAYVEGWEIEKRPIGYEAAKSAIVNAISGKRLSASVRYSTREPINYRDESSVDEEIKQDEQGNQVYVKTQPDLVLTTVRVEDLRTWLSGRGLTTGFFFPEFLNNPDYLDANHPNYTPKLAAAIKAWEVVTLNPNMVKAKSVKQVMMKWLRENAGQFGLTKDDGNPNEQGIEDIAKIANWDTKGGAPRTPNE